MSNKASIDRMIRFLRPMYTNFVLTEEQRKEQGLTKAAARAQEEKYRAFFLTFRSALEFCPENGPSNELTSYFLVDVYEGEEIGREAFLGKTEHAEKGEIGLLTKGMIVIDGKPVTLITQEKVKGKQARKNLEPRFAIIKWAAPEGVHMWPHRPPRGVTRLTLSVEEMKHAITRLKPEESRFHRAFATGDRRVHMLRLLGQAYTPSKQKEAIDGVECESETKIPQRLLIARDPFMIEKDKKGKQIVREGDQRFVVTSNKRFEIQDEGKGPFIIVPGSMRPLIILLDTGFLVRFRQAFRIMEGVERAILEKAYGALPHREVRVRKGRKNYEDARRVEAGAESEEEHSEDEEQEDEPHEEPEHDEAAESAEGVSGEPVGESDQDDAEESSSDSPAQASA